MTAADPINHYAFDDSWSSPNSQAALNRILTEDRPPTTSRQPTRSLRPRYVWSLVLAAAAGATALALGLQSAGTSTSGPTQAGSPAAWTVTKIAENTVEVKGSDYTHPVALERKLRAAGVAADVKTLTWNQAACGTEPPPSAAALVGVHGRVPGGVGAVFGKNSNGLPNVTIGPDKTLTITIHTDKIPPNYIIHIRSPASGPYAGKIVAVIIAPASWPPNPCRG